ncbi:MAG: EtfB protein [Cycloclasticus sp. symbiont of Bathymodiolus heckerae]|nr:MAG: EtfB protein [Cycloclasticus sp. symbiont of Bathymodiolus heckerae]
MKILVGVKRVVDFNVRIQVKPDGSGVATDGVKMSMNPFDEIAVEEALRIKEAGNAEEVIVATIGPKACQEQLRTALAMGADRAIHVLTDDEIQPLTGARILKALADKEEPQIVMLGKQAIDDDNNQTAQMLGALSHWPQATFASEVKIEGNTAIVTREVDAGLETLSIDLPAIISADLRLNEPRYVKLPDIMKAKRKPLEAIALADLNVEVAPTVKVIKTTAPAKREAGIKVGSVAELVTALKEKGLI